jgi:acetyl-CoA acetyltransferase
MDEAILRTVGRTGGRSVTDFAIDKAVSIVGIGQSTFSAKGGQSVERLILQAIKEALADAGLTTADVDGLVTEGSLMPQIFGPHDVARALRIRQNFFSAHSGTVGAGIITALQLAAMALDAGLATTVVSYFGVDWGSNSGAYAWHGAMPLKASLEMPFGFYAQPVYFAQLAQRYMHEYQVSADVFAGVPISSRAWAQHNPLAQERRPLDMEGYLASPMIADPMRRADCCLLTDGAAAFVMTTPERARDLRQLPVRVAACEAAYPKHTIHSFLTQQPDLLGTAARVTAPLAMAKAGVSHADVDLVCLYDCFSISALLQMEDMGFCAPGEGGMFFGGGEAAPGGRLPVNPHGGMMSEGYLMGITNINETVRQIRGSAGTRQIPDASIGVISGIAAQHATAILTRAI